MDGRAGDNKVYSPSDGKSEPLIVETPVNGQSVERPQEFAVFPWNLAALEPQV